MCAAIGVVAGFGRFGSAQQDMPKPTPTPAACTRPNVPATVVHAARAVVPPMAEQQDIHGTVNVLVSLGADSRVERTVIASTPSAILNQAALAVARASSYQTETRECRSVAADYLYRIDFLQKVKFSSVPGDRRVFIVGEGTVTRAPDVAYIEARIGTVGDAKADASARDDAAFAALAAKMRALGVGAAKVRTISHRTSFIAPQAGATMPPSTRAQRASGFAFTSDREIDITVDAVANAREVAAAAASVASVVVERIRFTLTDGAPAYREARDAALADAQRIAQDLTMRRGMRLSATPDTILTPEIEHTKPPVASVSFDTKDVPKLEFYVRATLMYTYGAP